jgi:beta-glucanase (GH16 family)
MRFPSTLMYSRSQILMPKGFFMRRIVVTAVLFCLVIVAGVMAQQDREPRLVDDFESGVPFKTDEYGNALGLVPWGDAQGNVTLAATQIMPYSDLILPGQVEANTALTVMYDIGGWGGFSRILTDDTNWISEDWSAYDGISFSLYGSNTGASIQIDLFDNRSDPAFDTAERYFYRVTDDYTGWREFFIPFSDFKRRTDFQPGGAPNDGLGLTEVSGYAFGFPAGVGAQVAYIDNVMLTFEDAVVAEAIATEETVVVERGEGEWSLVWADEFDGEAGTPPNPDNWTCEVGGHGWGNNEWEYYTNRTENAQHNGESELVITAIEETLEDSTCWYGECKYTSARCISKGKVEYQYGRVEARIKVPSGQGIWPAFWMLGSNFDRAGWPRSGEIDIMEVLGHEPEIVYGTVHGPGYSGGDSIGASLRNPEPLADDYHLFAMEWFEDEIKWYLDDQHYHTVTPDDLGSRKWAFDQPFFLLLNLAVGGNWPGYPDETTTFPQELRVDYVRWYEWQPTH